MNFLPYSDDEADMGKTIEILDDCCRIGFSVAFDASIYHGNFTVVMFGLTILKYVYKRAREQNIQTILDQVVRIYTELETQLDGPEDKNYVELIGCFRTDLSTNTLAFPDITENLTNLIYTKRN